MGWIEAIIINGAIVFALYLFSKIGGGGAGDNDWMA